MWKDIDTRKCPAVVCSPDRAHLRIPDNMSDIVMEILSATVSAEALDKIPGNDRHLSDPNYIGETPLHEAAAKGNIQIVRLLVENDFNVNAKSGIDKNTPLHFAAGNGHAETVGALVEAGADIEPITAGIRHPYLKRLIVDNGLKRFQLSKLLSMPGPRLALPKAEHQCPELGQLPDALMNVLEYSSI